MSEIILQTRSIRKKYGSRPAVDNVNLTVRRGEIYGLVGKNGAGKTTLLKLICGLTLPASGELEIFSGSSPLGLCKSRSRIGSMIETPSFFSYLSAERTLEYYRIQRGIPGRNCVGESLELVGLSGAGNKKFKNFSLGMKQRLGFALAIMGSPDLLILDEPINGLDPTGIVEFRRIIRDLNAQKNTTVLISSHILGELSQIATVYGFLHEGHLLEQITAKELSDKCRQCVSVTVDDPSKASVILEQQLCCTDFEVLDGGEIRVFQQTCAPQELNRALVSGGVGVSSLARVGASLENYFIDLIGDAKFER